MTMHQNETPLFRNGLISKAGTKRRNSDDLPSFASQYIPILPPPNRHDAYRPTSESLWSSIWHSLRSRSVAAVTEAWARARRLESKDVLNLRILIISIWVVVLWWGEERAFRSRINSCAWDRWETWAPGANPHHVVLIADPQIVDPHTYPGRPWPLSSLTVRYTDLYIRKSFEKISNLLLPDTVFFLGDLYDGGREWSNDPSKDPMHGKEFNDLNSAEERWRSYGQKQWIREYHRFGRMIFDIWLRSSLTTQQSRKLIIDLPGNHDLGLGEGIRLPARQRFNVFFGDGNRIDVIGNHSFVSIDTVSLSAKGQMDPRTGAQIMGNDKHNREVWEPVEEFLHNANALKSRAIDRALRTQHGLPEYEPQESIVYDLDDPHARTMTTQFQNISNIPSIVLTHIPLHRAPGTPCGPLRERFPPSTQAKDGTLLGKDEQNAIPYEAGYQYQNVLTASVSNEIVNLVSDVSHVFSGDDHDYCDVLHSQYTSKQGGIREITVKSISWAMGVRHPGFQLVSLWNPVDLAGKSLDPKSATEGTIQSHRCLLPDQLSIFIRYSWLLLITLVALLLNASRPGAALSEDLSNPILPVNRNGISSENLREISRAQKRSNAHSSTHSSSSLSADQQSGLASRGGAGRPSRSTSPGYGIPCEEISSLSKGTKMGWNDIELGSFKVGRGASNGLLAKFFIFRRHMGQVALPVLTWYAYLLWNS